jgi:hypothetical protein
MEIVNHTLTLEAIESRAKEQYALALRHAVDAKASARDAVLAMADCGQMLLMGRELFRHIDGLPGAKSQWVVNLGIPLADADKAVFLARNRDQLELDLWPQDVAKVGAQFVGMLPPPGSSNRATDDPERSTGIPSGWFAHANKLQRGLTDLFASRPVTSWREDERANVKLSLKPIVDLYNTL